MNLSGEGCLRRMQERLGAWEPFQHLLQDRAKLVRRQMDPRTSLNTVENRNMYCPCQESNTDSLAAQPIARPYSE
jgi:hypothetical protein